MGETKLVNAGSLKPGNYVIMGGVACIVKSIQTSKPGKHGSTKCRIEAVGIVDGNKKIEIHPSHESMSVPIIGKKNAQVLAVKGDYVNVMDMETYETFDLKIPEEFKGQIAEGAQIMYWVIMDDKVIKQVK
ncbi:MAG: translation initiation factor IF-5A [Candidatus Woesearchaeota archaeon]|nr:translation initiation factor IF-5A [Candidatus Woesearchaeota archaeon]